jgi:hypothetical protein
LLAVMPCLQLYSADRSAQETTVLYGRLAHAIVLLRRERADRLMSLEAATAAMAHELDGFVLNHHRFVELLLVESSWPRSAGILRCLKSH